jgi:GH18 family chitinase
MEKEAIQKKQEAAAQLSKKYNLEAMSSYNFDNVDFDFDFGTVDKKAHDKLVEDAQKYEK